MRLHILLGLACMVTVAGCNPGGSSRNKAGANRSTSTQASDSADSNKPAPDNTAINERDRNSAAKTPFDQSEDPADRETTAQIRQRVVDLPDASINAQNVKIITAGGQVTLRGPVNSVVERDAIERIAKDVAGADKVDNQLEVTEK